MTGFWIAFGERWARKQERQAKEIKVEKDERKEIRKDLRARLKLIEDLTEDIRRNDGIQRPEDGEPEVEGTPWPEDQGWWIEDCLCESLDHIRYLLEYLLKREEKLDGPK